MVAPAGTPRRVQFRDVVMLAVYVSLWFLLWGSFTATGFLLWDEGDFLGGGIQGALIGLISFGLERLSDALSARRNAGRSQGDG